MSKQHAYLEEMMNLFFDLLVMLKLVSKTHELVCCQFVLKLLLFLVGHFHSSYFVENPLVPRVEQRAVELGHMSEIF